MKEKEPKIENVGSPASAPAPQTVGSTDPVAPAAQAPENNTGRASVPASPDQPPTPIQSSKDRQDALDEAAKICGDLRNSIEAIGAFAITGHTDVVRQHYTIYVDRAKNLHAILSAQIENLPEL